MWIFDKDGNLTPKKSARSRNVAAMKAEEYIRISLSISRSGSRRAQTIRGLRLNGKQHPLQP
jgi:hypothetical protein